MSFSPHTDAKGIMDLVGFLSPKHVILVHGEKPKMAILKGRIESELGIPCFFPANNEAVSVPATKTIKVDVTKSFLRNCFNAALDRSKHESPCVLHSAINHEDISEIISNERTVEGILLMEKMKIPKFVSENELLHTLDAKEHVVQMAFCCPVKVKNILQSLDCSNGGIKPPSGKFKSEPNTLQSEEMKDALRTPYWAVLDILIRELEFKIKYCNIMKDSHHFQLKSFQARICLNKLCSYRIDHEESDCKTCTFFCCSWLLSDDILAREILTAMRELELDMSSIAFQVPNQVTEFMEM